MPRTDRKPVWPEEPEDCVGTCFACVPDCERRKIGPPAVPLAEAASDVDDADEQANAGETRPE